MPLQMEPCLPEYSDVVALCICSPMLSFGPDVNKRVGVDHMPSSFDTYRYSSSVSLMLPKNRSELTKIPSCSSLGCSLSRVFSYLSWGQVFSEEAAGLQSIPMQSGNSYSSSSQCHTHQSSTLRLSQQHPKHLQSCTSAQNDAAPPHAEIIAVSVLVLYPFSPIISSPSL
jgi:hypothetical protein